MKWYFEVIKKYTVFQGRASRKEYWSFFIINIIIGVIIKQLEKAVGVSIYEIHEGIRISIVYTIYMIWIFLPTIAVAVRRLHDTGKKGELVFLSLIPVIGWIALLFLLAQPSNDNENIYGSIPSEI